MTKGLVSAFHASFSVHCAWFYLPYFCLVLICIAQRFTTNTQCFSLFFVIRLQDSRSFGKMRSGWPTIKQTRLVLFFCVCLFGVFGLLLCLYPDAFSCTVVPKNQEPLIFIGGHPRSGKLACTPPEIPLQVFCFHAHDPIVRLFDNSNP